eukprot:jgi/Pico_ML_1/50705/g1866.t1
MVGSVPLIKNLLLLDAEGRRIAVKYYSEEWPTPPQQSMFETSLYEKTVRTTRVATVPEIIMFDDLIVVYKFINDIHFYATASADENELVLHAVLLAFSESVSMLLRGMVEKKTVLENLDLVLLAMDEIVDGGIILETDASAIANRVALRGAADDLPLAEQTFSQALASAKEQIAKSLLK